MKQQALLLDEVPDRRFFELPLDVQRAAVDLMAALMLQVYTQSEEPTHESASDRQ
jgi:hypothetical protein